MDVEGLVLQMGANFEDVVSALSKVEQEVGSFAAKMQTVGQNMQGALTEPLKMFADAAFDAATQFDDAMDKIRIKTGATGDSLTSLGSSFREVLTGLPESAGRVADAISAIATRTGETGPALEGLSKQFLNLTRMTGESLGPALEKGVRALQNWKVEVGEQQDTMDMLFRVTEKTGIGFTALSSQLTTVGPVFRELGFSLEQSAAMLGNFQKEGVNAERVIASMKKALGEFEARGMDPAKSFQSLAEAIKTADSAQAELIAAQVVGKRNAADFADAIRSGATSLDDLVDSIGNSKGAIASAASDTADWAEAWGTFKNQLMAAMEPFGAILFNNLTKFVQSVEPAVKWVGELGKAFAALDPDTQELIVGVTAVVAVLGPMIAGISGLVAVFPAVTAGFAAMAGSLTGLGAAAVIAAGAISAIQLSKALLGWRDAVKDLDAVTATLDKQTAGLAAQAAKLGISIDRGKMSIDEYATALNKAIRATPDYQDKLRALGEAHDSANPKIDATGKVVTKSGDAAKDSIPKWSGLGETIAKQARDAETATKKMVEAIQRDWDTVLKLLHGLPDSIRDMERAMSEGFNATSSVKSLNNEIYKLNQEILKSKDASEIAIKKGMIVQLVMARDSVKELAGTVADLKLDKEFDAVSESVFHASQNITASIKVNIRDIETVSAAGIKAIQDQVKQIEDVRSAMKSLGTTWTGDFIGALDKAKASYATLVAAFLAGDKLMGDAEVTLIDLERAKLGEIQKEIDLAKAQGESTVNLIANYNQLKISLDGIDGALRTIGGGTDALVQKSRDANQEWKIGIVSFNQGHASLVDLMKLQAQALAADITAAKALGQPWGQIDDQLKQVQSSMQKMIDANGPGIIQKQWEAFGKAVKNILENDLANSLSSAIVAGKGFGDALINVAKSIERAFVEFIVKSAIKSVMEGLDGIGSAITAIGKSLTSLFTGGRGGGGGVPGIPTTGGGGGGGGGGSIPGIGGLGSVVGMITGIGTMISGIVGNFQTAHMEKTLGLIEESTRYMKSYELQMISIFQKTLPQLDNMKQLQRLEAIENLINALVGGAIFSSMLSSLETISDDVVDLGDSIIGKIGEPILRIPATMSTLMVAASTSTTNAVTTALGSFATMLGQALGQGPMWQLLDINRQQNTQIISGVWATAQAVMKPGWRTEVPSGVSPQPGIGNPTPAPQAPQPNGSVYVPPNPYNPYPVGQVPIGPQPGQRPTQSVNVFVQQNTQNPYSQGLDIVRGMNAALPIRA